MTNITKLDYQKMYRDSLEGILRSQDVVTTIKSNAFNGCTNLETIDYPVSIKTDTNDVLEPIQYEVDWSLPQQDVCEIKEVCEYDYNCPFETNAECEIWLKKPIFSTTL